MKSKVFLGGTCNGSTWRDDVIRVLDDAGIDYFNPVVEDWTPECQDEEYRQKEQECDVHIYVITKEMTGVFSVAEVIDSAHTRGKVCLLQIIPDGFGESQYKSLVAVAGMVNKIGGEAYVGSNFDWIPAAIKRQKDPQKRLKKDIVIPAGTIMKQAPSKTERFGDDHFSCTVGLTDDSCGFLEYCLDDPALSDWFEDV